MGIFDFFRRNKLPKPQERSYLAAQSKARYGDLLKSSGSADYELRQGLSGVRERVRFLARNSSSMRRYISLMKVNIVGSEGFKLQSRVQNNDSLNERVESAYNNWCKIPTVDGVMSMVDLQSQMVSTWCRDGEVIWELVYDDRYVDGIAINPIEADLLDHTLVTTNPVNGNDIKMGVEIDAYGRPVAYHFLTTHPGDLVWHSNYTKQRYRRVSVDKIIHIFQRDRPGQTRGEPPASSVVQQIKMLDGYREAETTSRRVRAAIMGFFTSIMPTPDGVDKLADRQDEVDDILEMDMEPGRLQQLPPGLDFKEFNPGGAVTDYAEYEGQIKKDIAMGVNISVMSHGMQTEGISYSSGRTVLMEDRDYYKTMQTFFIRNGMWRVVEAWLRSHILSDDSQIPPSRMKDVLKRSVFRPRGWDWVDPAKDIKANTEALRTGQTSLVRVAAARGIDRDDLLNEIVEDQNAAKLKGLTLDYSDGKSENNNQGEDDDEKS